VWIRIVLKFNDFYEHAQLTYEVPLRPIRLSQRGLIDLPRARTWPSKVINCEPGGTAGFRTRIAESLGIDDPAGDAEPKPRRSWRSCPLINRRHSSRSMLVPTFCRIHGVSITCPRRRTARPSPVRGPLVAFAKPASTRQDFALRSGQEDGHRYKDLIPMIRKL